MLANEIADVLREKGVTYLCHANTVCTSCTFLEQGHLLSRGTVDFLGLPQTPQSSDELDQEEGLWFDLFLDTDDVHHRTGRPNIYGPVSFVLSTDLLRDELLPWVWITRTNPVNWTDFDGYPWFECIDEVVSDLRKGDLGKHLVLRCRGGVLPLSNHLTGIRLDPLPSTTQPDLAEEALQHLKTAADRGGILDPTLIRSRDCDPACECQEAYNSMSREDLRKRFDAQVACGA